MKRQGNADLTLQNRIWSFLNSGLGLWFLSTVVIGAFTFLFNGYSERHKTNSERENKIKQLDLEIESRISQFWVNVNSVVDHKAKDYPLKKGISSDIVRIFWKSFKNPSSTSALLTTTIYKDYETRTTISLMIELKSLLEEKSEMENADNPNVTGGLIRGIEQATVFIAMDGIYNSSESPRIAEIWGHFSKNIITDRWNSLFPFTDCLFC